MPEELGIETAVGDVFMEVTHTYPDITVRLTLFHVSITQESRRSWNTKICAGFSPADIPQYVILPCG